MAQKVASLYAEIGAETSGLKRGLSDAQKELRRTEAEAKKLNTTINRDFMSGLSRGSASMDDFSKSLLKAGNQAGLGSAELTKMAQATGAFSDKQLKAAQASAAVARKADELAKAVAGGKMTAEAAGKSFLDFARSQEVAAKGTTSLIGNMKSFAVTAGVVVGSLVAVGMAAKAAFEFLRGGAELEFTAQKFDRLAMSIGTTSDALMKDLRAATRGTVSDAQLMASASDFMALGLAKTHDQAVRLARVAGGLGMNMNQLVLTLANQTTMRFDQLGVSVDGFAEKVDNLKAAGMSANDAFKEAFLQQAEEQLERVGERADSAAGDFDRLAAATENLTGKLKVLFALQSGGIIGFLADTFEGIDKQVNANLGLAKAEEKGIITHQKVIEIQQKMRAGLMDTAEVMQYLDSIMGETSGRIWNQRLAWEAAQNAAADYTEVVKAKFADLRTAVSDPIGQQMQAFQKQQQELLSRRSELLGNIAFLQQGGVGEEEAVKIAELRGQIQDLNTAYQENANQYELRTKRVLFNMLLEKIESEKLEDKQLQDAYDMAEGVAKAWGIRGDATIKAMLAINDVMGAVKDGNIQGLIDKSKELQNVWLGMQGDYYVNFRVSVTGADLSKLGVAGAASAVNVIQPKPPKGFSGGGGGSKVGTSGATTQKKTRMQMLQETASALSSVGSAAQQIYETTVLGPLKQRLANLDALMTPGHIDLAVMDKSVQFMEERARAAQEVADAEKKVLELQKAQQRLALVEAQMRLLDLIKENKLNAKSILGDLKLGAGADMLGVIDATTRALDAIVGQMSGGAGGLAGGGSGGGGDLNWKRQVGLTPGTPEWDAASSMTFKEWKAKNGVKAASGFSGVIPAGFPNDSFPIWTSSGEHVLVTPPGEKAAGGSIYNINITMPLTNVTDMVDWERGAYRMSQILKRRLG